MSRTDKTQPIRVKMEEHRVCFPRAEREDTSMWYRTYKWWHPVFRCGCPMCGYDAFETPRRKKQRAQGKKECREWEREW